MNEQENYRGEFLHISIVEKLLEAAIRYGESKGYEKGNLDGIDHGFELRDEQINKKLHVH